MNVTFPRCSPHRSSAWLGTACAFLALGVQQPAFFYLGIGQLAIGLWNLRRERGPWA